MARHAEVQRALTESPHLDDCRKRVTAAGCQINPDGVQGAILFVPCTEEQLKELAEANIELEYYHILALQTDKTAIEKALKGISKKKRPSLAACNGSSPAEDVPE